MEPSEGGRHGSYSFGTGNENINEGRSYMKRFLVILVASMFLGSAAYAAQEDRKVGFTGEQKTPDQK